MRLSARGWQNSSLERERKNGENPKKQKKHFRGSGSDSRCGRCLWPFWSISGKSVSDSSDRGYTGAAV